MKSAFFKALALLLIGLKLTGNIDWSWAYVLLPLYIVPAFILGVSIMGAISQQITGKNRLEKALNAANTYLLDIILKREVQRELRKEALLREARRINLDIMIHGARAARNGCASAPASGNQSRG